MSVAGPPLLVVTMAPEAAEKLKLALNWAQARAGVHSDELRAKGHDERADLFAEHEEWLRWGMSRIINAEIDDA